MNFRTYEKGPDFERARTQIATPFQYIDIPLDTADSNKIFNISGDFLYVDPASTGVATIELNNQYQDKAAPFYIQSGFALQAVFKQVKLTWAAQAGKFLRLLYSTGDRVVPAFSAALSITGLVNTQPYGITYASSFASDNLHSANSPSTVFLPAANTGGAVVWAAEFSSGNGSSAWQQASFVAKSSAPTTVKDGVVVAGVSGYAANGTNIVATGQLVNPIRLPAGLGLYFISSQGESMGFRSALYTLL